MCGPGRVLAVLAPLLTRAAGQGAAIPAGRATDAAPAGGPNPWTSVHPAARTRDRVNAMSEAATPPRRDADGADGDAPASLAEIRAAIDAIDAELTVLLARRQRLVKAAAGFKTDERAVRAPGRVEEVLAAARRRALEHGLAPEVAEAVWSAMVGAFIDLELREHRSAARRASR